VVVVPARLISTKRVFILATVVGILSIASLATLIWVVPSGGPPRGGISRAQAIQAAWEHAGTGAEGVASAELRKDFKPGFDIPMRQWTWVVTFTGHWQLICQGACDRTTEWVAIDYFSGVWIASQYSYPPRQ
jgi:hypothetical protein